MRRGKADQAERTRRSLLDIARRRFGEQGYAGTGTEEIVRQAGVTRGALYYHFRDKQALFRAVVEDLLAHGMQQIWLAAATVVDPWERLRTALQAFLDACLDPMVRRIVLVEAPAVLGWSAWREIDAQYSLGLLCTGLQAVRDAALIEPQPIEPLAHMLLGALGEAGMVIAEADDVPAARAAVGESLDRLLRGLRAQAR